MTIERKPRLPCICDRQNDPEVHLTGCLRWEAYGRPRDQNLPEEALPPARDYTAELAKIDSLIGKYREALVQARALRVRLALRNTGGVK